MISVMPHRLDAVQLSDGKRLEGEDEGDACHRHEAQHIALDSEALARTPELATILQISSTSWLADTTVSPVFGLTWGHFVRPALIVLIVWALSLDTILRAARAHGFRRPALGLAAA